MTPFPETEIMTIKRIEVALRKMDLKLLKDGAYKLHEKFHSGFQFEYTDILKEIKEEVQASEEITPDIKGILIPTIDDILQNNSNNNFNENRVSSLTSIGYNHSINTLKEENSSNNQNAYQTTQTIDKTTQNPTDKPKFDAFSAFGTSYTQSPFSAKPFEEIKDSSNHSVDSQSTPALDDSKTSNSIINSALSSSNYKPFQEFESINQEPTYNTQIDSQENLDNIKEYSQEINEKANEETNNELEQESFNESSSQTQQDSSEIGVKTIAIYYHLNNSIEKIKNITKYRELISKDDSKLSDIVKLLNEINTQSNVKVQELKTILEQLISKNNEINLITNASSDDFTYLLNSLQVQYSVFDSSFNDNETFNSNSKINLMPLLGLTNLFTCSQCNSEYYNSENGIKPMIAQCPKCKSPMFPNLYAIKENESELNIDYYNSALIQLANSKVWLIIHPQLEDKTELNLLKTALRMNNQTENIFIVDKDINVRENCKKMFLEINKNLKINTQISAIEDFLNITG